MATRKFAQKTLVALPLRSATLSNPVCERGLYDIQSGRVPAAQDEDSRASLSSLHGFNPGLDAYLSIKLRDMLAQLVLMVAP